MTSTQSPRRAPQRTGASTRTTPQQQQQQQSAPPLLPVTEVDAELVPRFLNLLIPAVTSIASTVLPKVAPQIGGAIGGLFGQGGAQVGTGIGNAISGIFGGRDAALDAALVQEQMNRAVDEQQLMQVVTRLTQQCTPALISALQQTVQDRSSRGETGDVDDETMERSWGFLSSVIADAVTTFAPEAIKLATKALGSVVGSRDVDEYAPLLIDTEVTQRFVLPSLSAVLGGVQQVLPQLFTLVTSKRDVPRDTGISWQDLEATRRLWDGDNITVLGMSPLDTPDETELVLELAPHKTWWKGLQVQDDNGSFITEIGVQDRTKVATTRIRSQQLLQPGGYLVFMKAKAFGIHTGMYRLATGGLTGQLKGQRVHFYWYAD
ncbi:hypothetical protein [Actinoplanes sp. NPDC023714]|uniref:hypothetical protein n=1 Tax=Actinoplanes sp. NPDC023714 TaxID=3154322 RepID=UPI0033F6C308